MKELKITIKFSVDGYQIYTFPRNGGFFERAFDIRMSFNYNKYIGSPFFVTFAFKTQFTEDFPS